MTRCMQVIIMRQVVLCYKIGFREGVHTLGFGRSWGSGVRGWSQGSTGEWLDEIGLGQRKSILSHPRRRTWLASGSHRIRPGRCRSCRREDLVVSSYRVGLGVRGEELGVLEEVLGVFVSTTWASGFSGIRSGKKYLSHLRSVQVEELVVRGCSGSLVFGSCRRSWRSG